MHPKFLFLPLLMLVQLVFAQEEEGHKRLRAEINKIIQYDTTIDLEETPGFIIGVMDGEERYYLDFGSATKASSERLDSASVFEIGSCTKLFTSAILEDLVIKSVLSYDDLVNSFLPKKYYNNRLADLSISDLIYHKSTFPKRPSFFGVKEKKPKDPYAYFTSEDLLTFYHNFVPKKDAENRYSHCNYALLELIIEQVSKKKFSEVAQEYFGLWNLGNTTVEKVPSLSPGYDRAGRAMEGRSYASFSASEGIKSTVVDLCDYIQLHWETSRVNRAINNTLVVHGPSTFDSNIKIAKAWHVLEKGDRLPVYLHMGTTSGHKAYMFMVPDTQTAVVILANSTQGTQDLAVLILRMINDGWDRKEP